MPLPVPYSLPRTKAADFPKLTVTECCCQLATAQQGRVKALRNCWSLLRSWGVPLAWPISCWPTAAAADHRPSGQQGEGKARGDAPKAAAQSHCTQFPFYKNIFFLFSIISTDTKEKSGCWSSEAGAWDAAIQSLIVSLHCTACLPPSEVHVLHHGHWGERVCPYWDGSLL